MKKLLTLTLIFFAFFSVFSGASAEVKESENLRIVSLAPNITEIVYALGAGDELVGRSDYCNYPQEVLNIPCAGNVWQPNVEVIISMQPDVVLAASLLDPSYKEAIERAGIQVEHILCEENINGTYDLVTRIGKAIGKETEADALCKTIKTEFEETAKAVSQIKEKKKCVYLLGWGMFGDYAATGDTFINDLINLAGAENIAQGSQAWSISQELLIDSNPDCIILPTYSYAPASPNDFKATEPYSKLSGKILVIDGDIADRQGVRSPEFVKEVAKALYPEVFN